jgi:benzaldehyde dehydrogenase (NAD)
MANDNEFGLSSAVFTRDTARGWRWPGASSRASATSTAPPCTTKPRCRFGGVKNSGYGRFGGQAGIDAFTELRWITCRPRRATTRSEAAGPATGRSRFQQRRLS